MTRARGRSLRQPGTMNKTEAAFADVLEMRKRDGQILWWRYEGIKLRLADKTYLTPDFAIMKPCGTIELLEVKGFMESDAAVKLKVAADQYPFKLVLVRVKAKRDGGGWEETEI